MFLYGKDGENLITRPKEIYDGAIPSGNSIMTWNWIRLARITSNEALIQYARDTFSTFNKDIESYPMAYSAMLIGLLLDHESSQEIVVVGEKTEQETQRMISLIQESYRPFTTVLLLNESQKQELTKIHVDLESYNKIDGKTAVYVCENFVCRKPTTSVEELQNWL